MSITRLQQARQMYALGQRVKFYMGGASADDGHANDPGHGSNAPGGGDGNDRPTMADIAGPKSTTTQTMQDYMEDYATNVGKTANPRGGFFGDNTPEGKENNLINNLVATPPTQNKNKGFFDYVQQALGILSVISPHTALGKIGTTLAGLNKAKDIATTLGIDTKGVTTSIGDLFSGNTKGTSKGTTSTSNTNNDRGNGDGGGDGIASLENQAASYDEYILLLQKLQSGNISDSEQNRFNVLKNMLGI